MSRSTLTQSNSGLFTYSLFLTGLTFLLIIAGGLVTSHEAGLAVPDWPLSYGKLMPPMVGNVFWEHGHRMIAGSVGIFTLLFAFLIQKFESRTWIKKLGWVSLGAVVLQAILGGLTVLYLLPAPISIFHACLAQSFFSLIVAITYFLSPALASSSGFTGGSKVLDSRLNHSGMTSENMKRLTLRNAILIYSQLILGATVRHTGRGVVVHIVVAFLVLISTARVVSFFLPAGGTPGRKIQIGTWNRCFDSHPIFSGNRCFYFYQNSGKGIRPKFLGSFFYLRASK